MYRHHSHSSMGTTDEVKGFVDALKANGCKAKIDAKAGTVKVTDRHYTAFMAIQKGRGGPWIMRFTDSPRIQWSTKDETRGSSEDGLLSGSPGGPGGTPEAPLHQTAQPPEEV